MALLDSWLRKTFGSGTPGGRVLETVTRGKDPLSGQFAKAGLEVTKMPQHGSAQPFAPPDLTDDVLRQVRLAEMKRQQVGTTRASSFSGKALFGGLQ